MKDKLIKKILNELLTEINNYLDYVNFYGESAYSDRKIELIIKISKELEKQYKKQFKGVE